MPSTTTSARATAVVVFICGLGPGCGARCSRRSGDAAPRCTPHRWLKLGAAHAHGTSVNLRLATALAVCAFLAGCGREGNPIASFDTRCAKRPAPRFDVVATPLSFDRDDTRPIAELTVKSGSAPATHRTMGLTTAMFGQSTDIDLHVVDDRRGSRACGTPSVRVELSMQPMTVFIAREVAETPCQR